ncbi:MAG: wax ester/triacylglycerol synthase family O-acyltransferase [Rhodomicrobiaceae bacterium]
MSPADTTWLRMEQPANPMVIVGVLMLQGPVDLDRLERTIADRLLAIPRFHQRIEKRATGYWWSPDPFFNVNRHIKRLRLSGRGGKAELQRFVADLASEQLDQSHPLWEFHIVERFQGGAAVVARIHHAIADGIALIGVMLSLTDNEPAADGRTHRLGGSGAQAVRRATPWQDYLTTVTGFVEDGLHLSRQVWRQARERAGRPGETVREGVGVAGELAYLLFMPQDSQTRFKGKPSGQKRVAWTDPIALPEVKVVSRILGCSINDMLLAAVAGSLRAYLAGKGDATHGIDLRALVPVNLRGEEQGLQMGNQFGVVALELPVGIENPLARLYEIRRRMEDLKKSNEAVVTLGLITALGYAPRLVQDRLFGLLLSRASAVMTNVPGPQHPLYLAGARLRQVMFWVPQPGDIAMGVSILSFDGQVQFGVMTDAAVIPDPEAVIARFATEFEQLLYYVLIEPWGAVSAGAAPSAAIAADVKGEQELPVHQATLRRSPPTRTSKARGSKKKAAPR